MDKKELKKLIIKLLVMLSITSTNLEKKYRKKYGIKCYRSLECEFDGDGDLIFCDCEQKNIFRKTANSIGNIIWRLENWEYYIKNKKKGWK